MDIPACIEYLGLNRNCFNLTDSVPPHEIIGWEGPDPQPTMAELEAVWPTVLAETNLNELREERNKLLAETDYIEMPTKWATLTTEQQTAWATYRQALRDITETYTSLDDVVWPEKP